MYGSNLARNKDDLKSGVLDFFKHDPDYEITSFLSIRKETEKQKRKSATFLAMNKNVFPF